MRKVIKLTESQLKDIVVQKIMEQSDYLYKSPNLKRDLGYEKEPDETPIPMRRDWWIPIQNVAKNKFVKYPENHEVYFKLNGGKYDANFKAKGGFYFTKADKYNPIKNGEGKWVPNNQNGFTVTMNDGRVMVYTPQGGVSPVSITGGKTQWKTPTVKTLDDIKAGKGYLAKGMKGPLVGELQKIMLELNMKISKTGKVDNFFGPIMDLSIRQFQATNMPTGSKDGKVGQKTLNRMIEIRDYDGSEDEPEVDDSNSNDTNQMIEV